MPWRLDRSLRSTARAVPAGRAPPPNRGDPCHEPVRARRARSRPPQRLHRPGRLRGRDGAHLGEDLGVLRPRVPGAEGRRLLDAADRPPADGDGPRPGRLGPRALQPLPAPRRRALRQPEGQHRKGLRLLVPRVDLPPRRARARDPADEGLRRHAPDARQPRLQHEGRRTGRQLPGLRVREPVGRRPVARRVPRRREGRVRRHVRPLAARRGRGGPGLPPRDPALELEVLHGEPARRAASVGHAPEHRRAGTPRREPGEGRCSSTTCRRSRRASTSGTRCRP